MLYLVENDPQIDRAIGYSPEIISTDFCVSHPVCNIRHVTYRRPHQFDVLGLMVLDYGPQCFG